MHPLSSFLYLSCSTIVFFHTMFPLPSFSHFCTIYGCPPAISTSPHLYPSYSNVVPFTPTHGCIPTPCPHFRFFFVSFMPISLLPASSPTLPHCMTLFHYAPHPLDDPFDICFGHDSVSFHANSGPADVYKCPFETCQLISAEMRSERSG